MATKKTSAQLQREIDEALAAVHPGHQGRWDDSPGAWQRGYEFAKEAMLHETRAEMREILRRVAESASSSYDYGFLAAYQDELGVPRSRSHSTKKPHVTSPEGRLADLQRQGFMKRGPMRTWIVAVEAPSGDPSEATYVEVQGKTEAAALRAAQVRKPGRKLTVRYAK